MIDKELAAKIVEYLNTLIEADRPAIAALIANRVPCNQTLADHPTCQVGTQNGGYHVGLLGILNGLCGIYDDGPKKGWGAITLQFNDNPKGAPNDLIGFVLTENVELSDNQK